jgi:hypothetical protein
MENATHFVLQELQVTGPHGARAHRLPNEDSGVPSARLS